MPELKVTRTYKKKGVMDNLNVRAFVPEPDGSIHAIKDELGITREDFHAILDKASQPIKKEAESEKGQS